MPSGNKPSSEASHMATGPTGIHPLTLSYCTGFSPRGTDNTTPSGSAILEGLFPYLPGSSLSPKTSLKSLFLYEGAPLTNERAKLVNNGCFSSSSTANRALIFVSNKIRSRPPDQLQDRPQVSCQQLAQSVSESSSEDETGNNVLGWTSSLSGHLLA